VSGDPGLVQRVREFVSLSRTQAIFGLIAALLSIGGSVYGYLHATRPADTGELVAIVLDRADRPLGDATVEVLTLKDALVTTFPAGVEPVGRRSLKEGTYRLRVSHPKFAPEARTVQVMAGQTSEIRFRLGPRATATPATPGGTPPPVSDATRAVNEGVEAIKKIFK
jgi:hypothetical protein